MQNSIAEVIGVNQTYESLLRKQTIKASEKLFQVIRFSQKSPV